MLYYALKIALSAALIVAISEVAKRHTGFAALIASLPLTSLLAFVWLYIESGSTQQISELSMQVFWLVIPSLALFVLLPVLIKAGLGFWLSLGLSSAVTAGLYMALIPLLRRVGVAV